LSTTKQNLNEIDFCRLDACVAVVDHLTIDKDRLTRNEASSVYPQLNVRKTLDTATVVAASDSWSFPQYHNRLLQRYIQNETVTPQGKPLLKIYGKHNDNEIEREELC